MSQPQPSSLPHWRARQTEIGADRAIREAAHEVDRLVDLLGRKQDAMVAALCVSAAWGFVVGFGLAWWKWA